MKILHRLASVLSIPVFIAATAVPAAALAAQPDLSILGLQLGMSVDNVNELMQSHVQDFPNLQITKVNCHDPSGAQFLCVENISTKDSDGTAQTIFLQFSSALSRQELDAVNRQVW